MGDLSNDGAAPAAAASAAEPAGKWTRQKDKLLELLVARHAMHRRQCVGWDAIAAAFGDRTAAQVEQRYEEIAAEVRRVMEEPAVKTPPEWDPEEPSAAALPVAPVKHAAAGSDGAGVSPPSSDGGKAGHKRKKTELWTEEEHWRQRKEAAEATGRR